MKQLFKRLWQDESGQDLIEYTLLITLIVLAAVASFPPLASAIKIVFQNATTCLSGGACGNN
jgi:Flp pilus assembly pilin Flp